MRRKPANKNLIIAILIIMLLGLAVGYAAFGDALTISGTANAKGTFDLEFQNPEIVKNVGADVDKTTAVISADKNTLTVNVADLAYPGAGVEFAVDIVNVGTMPAEVGAVTPNNITGSDKIKVTGLEAIKTDHPKLEVGDRCNIHFTVEWPVDAGEILDSESSINFGLQIEYTQTTGEVFDGKASHADTDKEGNTINTNTTQGEEVIDPEPTVKEGKLSEIIKPSDYGKSINYKVVVKNNETNGNQEVSSWRVLYNDKSNIYLILEDYLQNNLVPTETGLDKEGTHVVNSQIDRATLLNGLRTTIYWNEFASGVEGATATGSPAFNILMRSYNEKYGTNLKTGSTIDEYCKLDETDSLYVPHQEQTNGVDFYWLVDEYPNTTGYIWFMNYKGEGSGDRFTSTSAGVRPVVTLPSSVTGTVGESIEIKSN